MSEIILIHSNINHPLYNIAFLRGPLQSALRARFTGGHTASVKKTCGFYWEGKLVFCGSVGLKETCFSEVKVRCSENRKAQSGEEMGIVMKDRTDRDLRLTEGAKTRVKHHVIMRYLEHDAEVHRSETTARFGRDRK